MMAVFVDMVVQVNYAVVDHHCNGHSQKTGSKKRVHTCNESLGLDVFDEIRLDEREPLFDASFNVATALSNVSLHFA